VRRYFSPREDSGNPIGMSAPNDQAPASGQESFGPYLVFERLGVGGMATVHRAKERGIEGFERIVALKRLLPHLAEDASFVKSFVREAKLASMLQHANIVQLYELGRVGSTYFISMEYIDGRDVRRILRQARKVTGPATINVTLSLLIQLCDALDYAHSRYDEDGNALSIVHRDVSPSNLLVTKSGHLKVIDFGIAKAQSSQLRTATGRVKGKLAYMAPEAISGKELDARSDIFSAGVIAHELLTARPLFASKNEYQTLIKVQRGDVLQPSTFNQACPPELDAIVLKALARDPDQRYTTAAQMRDDLHGVRIKYNLSATNREVQSWCEWAFSLEAPGNNFSGPMVTDSLAGVSQSRSPILPPGVPSGVSPRDTARTPVPLPLRAPANLGDDGTGPTMTAHQQHAHDEGDADVAWGGGAEHDSHEPVLLDEVPDVSSKYPAVPSGLGMAGQMAMGAEPSGTRKTLIGQASMPPPSAQHQHSRRSSQPNMWAQGSSEDAVAVRGRMPTNAEFTPAQSSLAVGDDTTRTPLVEGQSLGTAGHQKKQNNTRVGIIAGAAVLVAGAAVAIVMMKKGGPDAPPVAAKPQTGKVKFVIEPPDSTVKIAGIEPHNGSPYAVDLDPGQIQVQIQHDGFRSYVTTVDLSAGETQTLRVVLEQGGKSNTAGLALDSTPPGLVAILDGNELPQRTPLKMEVQPGPHVVTLKQNGAEVWRQEFMASADQNIEYKPILTEEKKRERAEQAVRTVATNNPPTERVKQKDPTPVTRVVKEEGDIGSARDRDNMIGSAANTGSGVTPPETHVTPPPADKIKDTTPPADTKAPPVDTKAPPPAPDHKDASGGTVAAGSGSAKAPPVPPVTPVAPKAGSPAIVSPGAVHRVSGSLPTINTVPRAGEAPPAKISTMLCIDTSGNVTTVKLLTKGLPGSVPGDITNAMQGWKYQPYKQGAAAAPACFVVSFAVKWPENSRGN
jgi:serine/threonine protein kinase